MDLHRLEESTQSTGKDESQGESSLVPNPTVGPSLLPNFDEDIIVHEDIVVVIALAAAGSSPFPSFGKGKFTPPSSSFPCTVLSL